MPRTCNKKRALNDIKHAAQAIAGYIALSKPHGNAQCKTLEVLVHTHAIIQSNRYFSRSDAGQHQGDILDKLSWAVKWSIEWGVGWSV